MGGIGDVFKVACTVKAELVSSFTAVAVVTIVCILLRRWCLKPSAELGGNKAFARTTFGFFCLLYLTYIALSIVRSREIAFVDFLAAPNDDCIS